MFKFRVQGLGFKSTIGILKGSLWVSCKRLRGDLLRVPFSGKKGSFKGSLRV